MKERVMTTVERLRRTTIKETLDGTITNSTASVRLGITVRQVQRLKKGFKIHGHDSLIHGSRGKTDQEKQI